MSHVISIGARPRNGVMLGPPRELSPEWPSPHQLFQSRRVLTPDLAGDSPAQTQARQAEIAWRAAAIRRVFREARGQIALLLDNLVMQQRDLEQGQEEQNQRSIDQKR